MQLQLNLDIVNYIIFFANIIKFLVAPHIHREDLEDTVIKVGEQLRFNVKSIFFFKTLKYQKSILVDGEPPPIVTWTFEGNALQNVNIEDENYLSKFLIAKAVRKQSGKYTITATNNSGTDTVTVKVYRKQRAVNFDQNILEKFQHFIAFIFIPV